jgi:Berberine and berberine like
VLSQWKTPDGDKAGTTWARESNAALQLFVGRSRYLNYLDHDDADASALAAAYGPNVQRLRSIKAKYDPENVFHLNMNVAPKA